ncbi:uncharacterized protein involved in outer membrane biogenesis [Silvimonas terrae]|uniref:Uncharacterized protein involved in outer membrane biogenesis n=1 Tax=Silvimonas terrae TaxID=300266 RepID=A0A840RK93_9NEIS|nr:DUF748 domain-containing protein [Silvimonas terrae]MBB5193004.1 uncharacterized protein involved in outer membrane biogenesis [Silvimonas terrae]
MPALPTRITAFVQTPGRIVRWLTGLVVLLVAISILGFLLVPWLARPQLEKALSAALQRPTTVAGMAFNPFTLQARLDGLDVREHNKTVLSAAHITANLDWASLWRRGPVLSKLTLDTPYIWVQRTGAQQYNWSDLLKPAAEPKPRKEEGLPRFALYNIRLNNGRIDFDDRVVNKQSAVTAIDLGIPFISSLPVFVETEVEPSLAFKLDGSPFEIHGKTTPFENTRQTSVDLKVDGLDIPSYLKYVPVELGLRLPAAKFDSQLQLVFRQEHNAPQLRLTGSAQLRDVDLTDAAGKPLLVLPKMRTVLADVRPLAGVYHLQSVETEGLHLTVAHAADGSLNWLQALAPAKAQARPASAAASAAGAETAAAGSPPDLAIASVALRKSRVDWIDEAVKPAFSTSVDPLDLTLQHVSLDSKTPVAMQLNAVTTAGEKLSQQGTLTLQPLSVQTDLTITGLSLARYQPYVGSFLNATLADGTLDWHSTVHMAPGELPQISGIDTSISHLKLNLPDIKDGNLQWGKFSLTGAALDLPAQRYHLGQVALTDPVWNAARATDGQIDWTRIVKPQPTGNAHTSSTAASKPLRVTASGIAVSNFSSRFLDHQLPKLPPVTLKSLTLQTGPIDYPSATPTDIKLQALGGHGGKYEVSGSVANTPAAGKLKLNLQNLDIGYGQAYFSRWLNVTVPTIKVSMKGDLVFGTAPKFTGSYKGNLRVADLYSIDKVSGEDFLKWKSLDVNGIDARFEPLRVNVNTVALQNFYSRLVLYPDGHLNLADIVVKEGQPRGQRVSLTNTGMNASAPQAATPTPTPKPGAIASAPVNAPPAKPLPPIRIGTIKLAGGNINYTDNFVKPNYTANLTDMGGTISGLSSAEDARATLDIKGSVDRIAPVAVSGQLNPLAQQLFLDITASVKGYELAAASTYSAKYAGYGIEKGKLSMDVHYQIANRKLQAQNKIMLDQLTLGDKVDSPDATKLPVRLALSLLTDHNGQINLDLPVAGSLDDPQFSVGGLIIKVIVNLLEKAITAPFDLLANAFGGGPQFAYAPFEPGSAVLDTKTQDSLDKLQKALTDRPAIKMEITGWADPNIDLVGLRKQMVQSRMKAIKARQLTDRGETVTDESALEITPQEYPQLLTRVYKQAKFPDKPTNLIGMDKSLPTEEMEKQLFAHLPVNDNDLRQLASQRSLAVKDFLQQKGVDAARLYVTQPRVDGGGADKPKDGGPTTRAAFKLN